MNYKTTRDGLILIICLLMATHLAQAQTTDKPSESGWDSEIAINVGYSREQSRLSTEDDQIYSDYDSKAGWQSDLIIAPLATFNYNFQNLDKQFFVGTAREDIAQGQFHTQIGFRHWLPDGSSLSLSYIPGLLENKVWGDPFVLNDPRAETDQSIHALRLQYKNILTSNFNFEMALGERELDEENSGYSVVGLSNAQRSSLNRNATIIYLRGDYGMQLGKQTFFQNSLTWTGVDADGEAMAHDRIGLQFGLIQMFSRSRVSYNLEIAKADYDAVNPIFQATRRDSEYSLFIAHEYDRPFDWQNVSLVSFGGWGRGDSNIGFYDSQGLFLAVGLNYKF
jgi:hypothetical protein